MTTPTEPPPPVSGVHAAGATRRFGPLTALDAVDLQVLPGRIAVILGPNGAGKTTLLRVLATLAPLDGGRAWVGGASVAGDAAAVRRRIGFAPQQAWVYPDLTAEENLRFHARLHGLPDDPGRLSDALAAAGLDGRRHQRTRTFSHGLCRRLAIVRALSHDPAVLLLDEPHAGLDPDAADWLDATVRAAAARGRAVVLTTHDLDRAGALADEIVILRRGRVAWRGGRAELPAGGLRPLYDHVTRSAGPVERRDATPRLDSTAPPPRPRAPRHAVAPRAGPANEPPHRGLSVLPAACAIAAKDVRVELRAREIVPAVLTFALVMLVIFQFTLPADPTGAVVGAAGALWVALLFGASLGLARAFGAESDGGALTGLVLAPVDRGAVFLGKWLSGWLFALAVGACLLVAGVAWLNLPPARLPALALVVALGLVGWTAAGTLLGALAGATRAREVLLPVLLYPAVLPLVIPAVGATGLVLAPQPDTGTALAALLSVVAAYDVILMVLGFLLFPYVVES